MPKKRVMKSAVRTSRGVVQGRVGGSHADIGVKGERGFTLSDGKFAGRKTAATVAKRAGQVKSTITSLHSSNLKKKKGKAR